MKKNKTLLTCGICKRPLITYTLRGPNYKNRFMQSQGPKRTPKIKRWCLGHCEGLLIEIQIMVNDLIKLQSPNMKSWAKCMLDDIEHTYKRLIIDLVKKKNIC